MYGLGKFNYDLLFVNSGSAYDSEAFGYYEGRFNIAVYSYNIIASVNQSVGIRGRNCIGSKRLAICIFDYSVALRA